jgi:DNA-binding MarR family transcriptional regulator
MGTTLLRRLEMTKPFARPVEDAVVSVMVAAAALEREFDRALEPLDLTDAQYNVLRILRGARPGGHPREAIARRMVRPSPDVTRFLDRLAARGLVVRARGDADRRQSVARITEAGLALLVRADRVLAARMDALEKRLPPARARVLSRLCESLYGGGA